MEGYHHPIIRIAQVSDAIQLKDLNNIFKPLLVMISNWSLSTV